MYYLWFALVDSRIKSFNRPVFETNIETIEDSKYVQDEKRQSNVFAFVISSCGIKSVGYSKKKSFR